MSINSSVAAVAAFCKTVAQSIKKLFNNKKPVFSIIAITLSMSALLGADAGSMACDSRFKSTDVNCDINNDEAALYYEYIRENLRLLDVSSFPYSNDVGVLSALIDDFNSDGVKEMVTASISLNAADQKYIILDLYGLNDNEVEKWDTSTDFSVSGVGNFSNSFCVTYENQKFRIQTITLSYGGSSRSEEYVTLSIGNNSFVLETDYDIYEFYRNDDYRYEEKVSNEKYSSCSVIYDEIRNSGYLIHSHDYENVAQDNCNHMFIAVNSNDSSLAGVHGFILDSTDLSENISENANNTNNSENSNDVNYSDKYSWIVQPDIEAEDINVIRCCVGDTDYGQYKYDRISVISRESGVGLINYAGGIITGVDFECIEVYDQQYLLFDCSKKGDTYYTLSSLYELKKINEDTAFGIVGGGFGDVEEIVWIDSDGLYLDYDAQKVSDIPSGIYAVRYLSKNDYQIYDDSIWITAEDYKIVVLKDGKLINSEIYEDAGAFSDGVISVKLNGKWGYIDQNGSTVLPFEFDACWNSNGTYEWKNELFEKSPYNASDGYIVVSKNGEYALYDVEGNIVIEFGEFEKIRPVYEGMCWVETNGRWGVIALEPNVTALNTILPEKTFQSKTATVKSSSGLRMREGPGTNYYVISILSNKTKVTLCGVTGDWSYICYDSIYGWVKSEYLEISNN